MTIRFTLKIGALRGRGTCRQELENSRRKLEYWYPGCRVLLTEKRGLMESEFYFEASELPDTQQCREVIRNWERKLRSNVD